MKKDEISIDITGNIEQQLDDYIDEVKSNMSLNEVTLLVITWTMRAKYEADILNKEKSVSHAKTAKMWMELFVKRISEHAEVIGNIPAMELNNLKLSQIYDKTERGDLK